MSDLRRLVERDELFARAVEEARRERPPRDLLKTILTSQAAPRARVGAAAPRTISAAHPWIALPVGLAGLLALLLWNGVWNGADRRATRHELLAPPPRVVIASPARGTPGASPRATTTAAPEAAPSVAIEDLPDWKRPPSEAASVQRRTPTPPPVPRGSAAPSRSEIELITRAREALTRSDARACLAVLDLHDREFSTGRFMPEAAMMRIEATAMRGDRALARQQALEFLARNPGSLYEPRVRSLLASLERP